MRSNPASRTMVAMLIDDVLKRPEFAGVNAPPSTKGEGGQALAAGEGDMAIQTISQILPYKEIELVGPLPAELGAWIDSGVAVSARATHATMRARSSGICCGRSRTRCGSRRASNGSSEPRRTVIVEDYDPSWPRDFEILRQRIWPSLVRRRAPDRTRRQHVRPGVWRRNRSST